MNDQYMGVIQMVGFKFVPENFGYCGGALVDINQYMALYSLLGTYFGGDGRVSFALPDLRGRLPMGFGAGPGLPTRVMGQRFGYHSATLSLNNLPSHNHDIGENVPGGTVAITGSGSGATGTLKATTQEANTPAAEDGAYLASQPGGLSPLNVYRKSADVSSGDLKTLGGLDVSGGGASGLSASFNANNLNVSMTGNGDYFDVSNPTQVVNFVICMQGLYPSRS